MLIFQFSGQFEQTGLVFDDAGVKMVMGNFPGECPAEELGRLLAKRGYLFFARDKCPTQSGLVQWRAGSLKTEYDASPGKDVFFPSFAVAAISRAVLDSSSPARGNANRSVKAGHDLI